MALPNIFSHDVSETIILRINQLAPNTQPLWGKMNIGQMLAHCNVTYEMVYEDNHPKPNLLMRTVLKMIVKTAVTNEIPYKRDLRTAPQFKITDEKDFELEKTRLINFIHKTALLGEASFESRASHSFGVLNKIEWNNMFYKHLDHHLTQFGV